MTTQATLWTTSAALTALAALAVLAEHRRARRRDLDKVGIMPWNLIQYLAFLAAILVAALAFKA